MVRKPTLSALRQDWQGSLSGDNGDAPTVDLVPDGFKVVDIPDGLNFHCESCDVAVKP
jgi:hypothetical protein